MYKILFLSLSFVLVIFITFVIFQFIPKGRITDFQVKNQPIPKVIHKILLENEDAVANRIRTWNSSEKKAHDSWTKMNHGYIIKYWNMNSCKEYLKSNFPPIYISTFNCIQAYSGKCNFFKYCIIFNEGGWYSDWKQICLKKDLLNKLAQLSPFTYFHDKGNFYSFQNKCVQNAFFGSIPKNPILQNAVDVVIEHTRKKFYGKCSLDTTGPCAFGKVLQQSLNIYHIPSSGKFYGNNFEHNRFGVVVHHKYDYDGSLNFNYKHQNWKNGNNYTLLWLDKKYYCSEELPE
jgi:hypothetical protein